VLPVPVVVTDRKGHFITDLKASDFRVFEDGVEQKLTFFTTHEDATPDLLQPDTGKEPAPHPSEGESAAPPLEDWNGGSKILHSSDQVCSVKFLAINSRSASTLGSIR
jgi:hypothetical protein